jgi:hypothetical protein
LPSRWCGRCADEWDPGWLVAFADDEQGAVPAFEAEVFDVRTAGFADPKAVEPEQHGQRSMHRRGAVGRVQECSELAAVHPTLSGLMDPRSTDVLRGVGGDPAVDVREAVVTAHGGQAAIDGRRGEPALFHGCPIQLDVRPAGSQWQQPDSGRPLEELAQVCPVRLQGPPAIAGEERNRRQLRFIKQRQVGSQHRGRGWRFEHGHGQPPGWSDDQSPPMQHRRATPRWTMVVV